MVSESEEFKQWIVEEKVTAEEAAEYFGVSVKVIYTWRSKNGIPKTKWPWIRKMMNNYDKHHQRKPMVSIAVSDGKLRSWTKSASTKGQSVDEWAEEGLDHWHRHGNAPEIKEDSFSVAKLATENAQPQPDDGIRYASTEDIERLQKEIDSLRKLFLGMGDSSEAMKDDSNESPSLEDLLLSQELKHWRSRQSSAEDVPAFVVLGNASIMEIGKTRPRTLEALKRIKGIGKTRVEKYGEAILGIVEKANASKEEDKGE